MSGDCGLSSVGVSDCHGSGGSSPSALHVVAAEGSSWHMLVAGGTSPAGASAASSSAALLTHLLAGPSALFDGGIANADRRNSSLVT